MTHVACQHEVPSVRKHGAGQVNGVRILISPVFKVPFIVRCSLPMRITFAGTPSPACLLEVSTWHNWIYISNVWHSCYCGQILDSKHLKRGKVHFGLQLESIKTIKTMKALRQEICKLCSLASSALPVGFACLYKCNALCTELSLTTAWNALFPAVLVIVVCLIHQENIIYYIAVAKKKTFQH